MSGPVLIDVLGGNLGGEEVNRLVVNGFAGIAALYPPVIDDEYCPPLYIGGRLNLKEVVCEPRRTPFPKVCPTGGLRPPCTKVK